MTPARRRWLGRGAIVVLALALLGGADVRLGPPLFASHEQTSVSPDGRYRVDVYSAPLLFAMPGGGGAGQHDAIVVLRNRWGWKIGSNDACREMIGNIAIRWGSAESVEIAPARTIRFADGECEQ